MKSIISAEFSINWRKWKKNSQGKENKPLMASDDKEALKPPLTPFRRNKSRVFYASHPHVSSERNTTPTDTPNTLKIKVAAPSNSLARRRKSNTRVFPQCSPTEIDVSDGKTPLKEINENLVEEISPICSPIGSWRGSTRSSNGSWRCSPSQRSQDSGYSDSGESNAGYQNEVEEKKPTTEPEDARHVTRIYCSDHSGSLSPSENLSKLSTPLSSSSSSAKASHTSVPRVIKVGKRRNNKAHKNIDNKIALPKTPVKKSSSVSTNNSLISSSPTTSSLTNNDECENSQLEHKSLLDVSSSSPSYPNSGNKKLSKDILKPLFHDQKTQYQPQPLNEEQPRARIFYQNAKTSSRAFRKVSQGKRIPRRRSKSSDKLLLDRNSLMSPLQPEKNSRRWSSVELGRNYSPAVKDISTSHFPKQYSASTPFVNHFESPFDVAKNLRNDSVAQWVSELQWLCESECMNTLQSKSVPDIPEVPSAVSIHERLAKIQKKAHGVSAEFARLCQRLEQLQLTQVPALVRSLVSFVDNFIHCYCNVRNSAGNQSSDNKNNPSVPSTVQENSLKQQVKVVDQICSRLSEISRVSIEEFPEGTQHLTSERKNTKDIHKQPSSSNFERLIVKNGKIDRENIREFVQVVTALGHAFTKLVDILLTQGIEILITMLKDSVRIKEVESAINEITELGINGGHVCRLVGRVGGIQALLKLCTSSQYAKLRPISLRSLATVCCVAESIAAFVKEGGIEIIAEILCGEESSEEEKSEAAGVLAQITSPWVEDNNNLPSLGNKLNKLVRALTDLASSTRSPEVFLLTSAAVANLTFLDNSCVDELLLVSTHEVLFRTAREDPNLSVFTKDQIATILANISSSNKAAKKIAEAGGIEVLISFLHTKPTDALRIAEIEATERVQQKAAIALSRISTDPDAANQVLSAGGATRLVCLCKNERERNHSDAVLVACLAALRKISSSCGNEELRQVDAIELVEPRLLDSFLIYSSQQESFV